MRLFAFTLLLAAPFTAFASEAAIPAVPDGAPAWVHFVWPILFAVIIPFAVKWLNSKSVEAKHKAEKAAMEASTALGRAKNQFIDQRLIPFLYATAGHLAETRLPVLLADVVDGGGFDWKKHLADMRDELKKLAIAKFKVEGFDLVENMGEDYLNSLLDRAISKALPFIPQIVADKANEVSGKLSRLVVEKGLEIARDRWLEDDLDN